MTRVLVRRRRAADPPGATDQPAGRGIRGDLAASGTQALEEAAAHPPDLVILDLGLPDMDGVEVIGGLRGWTAVPIMVLSGRADRTDKVEALDAGADDYVTKPFGMDELLARMRAVVRRTRRAETQPRLTSATSPSTSARRRARWTASRTDGRRDASDVRPDADRVAPARGPGRNPGKLLSQRQLLHRGLGSRLRQRERQPAALHGPAAPQARARPGQAALAAHRAGMGYRFQPPDQEAGTGERPRTGPGRRAAPRSRRIGRREIARFTRTVALRDVCNLSFT